MQTIYKNRVQPEHGSSRRKQVLDAAETCFTRTGFRGATMVQISKQAGMSAGHIYNYFGSKDEIVAAIVGARLSDEAATTHRLLCQCDDMAQLIASEAVRLARLNVDPQQRIMPLEILAEAARNPAVATLLSNASEPNRSMLSQRLLHARREHGLPATDGMIAARVEVTLALLLGMQLRRRRQPEADPDELANVLRLVLTPLLFS